MTTGPDGSPVLADDRLSEILSRYDEDDPVHRASFQRRGMPFRDAFDSAFDDIVAVPPLTYEDARGLLNRRVIGISIPFISLAYVLSGGLARDLIRAVRKQVAMAEHAHDKLLSTLSRGVVKDEVTAKLAAVQAAVSTNEGSGSRTQILKESDRLDPSDPVSLLDSARVLMTAAPKVGSRGWTKASMATDLATYLYFAATVIEYFSDSLTEDSLKEAEGSGLLDELAACRQAFTAGPPFAWQQVSDCRSKCGLPRLPDWPTA